MTTASPILEQVARLCEQVAELDVDPSTESAVSAILDRLEEPLRVAIVGRVNAGKSTLLNALVGERLAPTDAGETTRVVTWYRRGIGYEVNAKLRDGSSRALEFERGDGELDIDLGGTPVETVDQIEVSWPSGRLAELTLIDTPGLEGKDADRATRTREFLGVQEGGPGDADAVVYLMRHLHGTDADFLEAFLDRSVPHPSPANAVGVLSRADEVGGGRIDALESAQRIGARYAADDRVRALCATVVPIAGLLAETGVTLREDEAASLRALADLDDDTRRSMLLSVDRFLGPGVGPLATPVRRSLLARLGLFGVRFCIARLRDGDLHSAADLSRALLDASGIDRLRAVIDDLFGRRAQVLKARSGVSGLKAVLAPLSAQAVPGADSLLGEIEQLEMGADEFVQLRLLYLVRSGNVEVSEEEVEEIDRLVSAVEPAPRLGLPADSGNDELRAGILAGIERWRTRAAHPLATAMVAELSDLVVRTYEGLHAELSGGDRGDNGPS